MNIYKMDSTSVLINKNQLKNIKSQSLFVGNKLLSPTKKQIDKSSNKI